MPKEKVSFEIFGKYIPERAIEKIKPWFSKYKIQIIITRERKTILGNYRHPTHNHPVHRITINGNQNRYSFLITLLHELAHLEAFVRHKNSIAPHGPEWKNIYSTILLDYLTEQIFPNPVALVLQKSINKIKASSCADPDLHKVLMQYDEQLIPGLVLVENVSPGCCFVTKDGRLFQMIAKRRTRYLCKDLRTQKDYLFSGLVQVKLYEE